MTHPSPPAPEPPEGRGVLPPGDAGVPQPGDFGAAGARAEVAARFAAAVRQIEEGKLRFPLPGSGATGLRFAALRGVAEEDLAVARLVEGHTDALAILAELAGPPPAPGQRWGVWAAEPPGEGVRATYDGTADTWTLSGLKQYASGAHSCTHALVTARTQEGQRLFAVRLDRGTDAGPGTYEPAPGTWPALGMAGSDTPDVRFEGAPALPVGDVDAYVHRPGFAHGGVGVAACWLGGAHAVTGALRRAAARRGSPFTDAHLGAADLELYAAGLVLERAAAEIDADPVDAEGGAEQRALRVRALVAACCERVLTHVGRATGAGPLCHDARHARAVADLTVYVRQHHAERDLAALGALVAGRAKS
ncbi:acyl-CoA dehydrogenase [Streptomyces sp. NPDC088923]|uniref:acyl-CoA dehydrogenase n=1 Tax=Streptomyces sp. NPDC088923 TaxID=3365913 RepID=UPI0038148221